MEERELTPKEQYALLRERLHTETACTPAEIAEIDRAFALAEDVHSAQLRYSGQPYIIHPIAVANILVDFGMDAQSIEAALLHDTVEDTDVTLAQLKSEFGDEVAALVDGVTKLGKVPLATKEEFQAENLRKMLLAMYQDIRVIIIKLADRLHNMRTLDFMAPQKKRDIALETIEIYAPIAHRLGIRAAKEELEDLAIRFLDPIAYADIEKSLDNMTRSRLEFLEDMKEKISARISTVVKSPKIDGRVKSVHGIYRKMYMQNKNFDQIYDIYAIRIIVDSVIDCYNCLGLIHDMFRPMPGRFKDYISTPKPNMYQSLHTTVLGTDGIPFEVQIRTWEMHRTAEFGIAAHWKYKLGLKGGKSNLDERLAWIRQMLDDQKESGDVQELVRAIKSDLIPEDVFVFTPRGDVINLPSGATVIDFAYAIHTAVGNKMVGAKVDGRIVPIDYKVKTGEIVEVLTSSQQGKGPSRDWLSIAKTSSARNKIRSWFKNEKRDENIAEGKAEIEREFRRNYIRLTEEEYDKFIRNLAARQRFDDLDDFYAAIGFGGVSVIRLMPYIKEEYNKNYRPQEQEPEILPTQVKTTKSKGSDGVTVEGVDNVLIKFSRCCNPLPGDNIIGFITRGHGISVHKRDCTNVPKDISACAEPERWVQVRWNKDVKKEFKAALQITSLSRIGLMADISVQLANMRVNINEISSRVAKDGRSTINMNITVSNVDHLKNVISRIEKVDGVLSVER